MGHVQIATTNWQKNNCALFQLPIRCESVRFFEIDFLRGAAVLMMVLFHFLWDANFFGYTSISLYEGYWGAFQKITASTFLFLVGVSLAVSYGKKKENFEKKLLFRSAKIFGLGALITLFSLVFFPQEPIFFGILHLIAVSIILSIFFARFNFLNLLLGALIILSPLFFDYSALDFALLYWAGFAKSPPTLDFFPVIPWFGVVLIGIFAGKSLYENANSKIKISTPKNKALQFVGFLGRHSLLVYFIHQPILFSIVGAAKFFL